MWQHCCVVRSPFIFKPRFDERYRRRAGLITLTFTIEVEYHFTRYVVYADIITVQTTCSYSFGAVSYATGTMMRVYLTATPLLKYAIKGRNGAKSSLTEKVKECCSKTEGAPLEDKMITAIKWSYPAITQLALTYLISFHDFAKGERWYKARVTSLRRTSLRNGFVEECSQFFQNGRT